MIEGADGYRTDIGYVYGYHGELNPLRVRLAFLNAGLQPPEIATACELGFGQGVSLVLHAAASPVQWHGTDINPAHAAYARTLAMASGTPVDIRHDSFVDFSGRDLPAFDYIGLHGVWSWISDGNRATIVEFVRRHLKPGGVLYTGYNTLPGWAAFSPLRHLMVEHANRPGSAHRPIAERIDDAVDFSDRLLAAEPAFARDNPGTTARIKAARDEDRPYLAHEFFNRDWQPMHFTDVARALAPAGVGYVCAADYSDHLEAAGWSASQRSLIEEADDAGLRETVRDMIANQRFRRDYWVRGAKRLSAAERTEALRLQRVIAVAHPLDFPFKVKAALALSLVEPGEAVCGSVIERLADGKAWSLGQIEQALQPKGISIGQIAQAVVLIASNGLIEAAQEDATTARVRSRTDRLNAHLIAQAGTSDNVHALASPVTGGGIHASRKELLFLAEVLQGRRRPDDWAGHAAKVLATGASIVDLTAAAHAFATDRLPLLRALQVV